MAKLWNTSRQQKSNSMVNQAKQNMQQRQKLSLRQKILVGSVASVVLIVILFFVFKIGYVIDTSADDTGGQSPASASTSGGSGKAWNTTSYVYSSDNNDAYCRINSSGSRSEYLEVTNYGFAIPSNATIDGIEVAIEKSAQTSNNVEDARVYLTKTGTSNVGSDYAKSGYWTTSDAIYNYGGASDLWGTTWSVSEINSSSFGVRIRASNDHANRKRYAYIDHVTITVHYTIPPSPGGVSSNMAMWLDAGTGVTGTTQVSNWADQSGNSNDAAMSTSTYRPELVSNAINNNDAIDFDGGDEYLQASTGGYTDDVFVVLIPDDNITSSLTGQIPVSLDANNASIPYAIVGLGSYTSGLTDEVIHYGVGQTNGWKEGYTSSSASYAASEPIIINISNDDGTSSSALYVNQTEIGNANYGFYTTAETDVEVRLGGNMHYVGGYYYDGKIAEFITYSSDLSASDRKKVTSYLAIKYGITLGNDYVMSDGTTVWNSSSNSTYHNDVAGIARDDDSNLDQQKSTSENNDAIMTLDKGGAFSNDLDAIIWGNNNAALTQGTSNGSTNYPKASNRTWKVELNGTPGSVSVDIDLSGLGMTGGAASDYALLIDSDGNFTSGASEHTTGASLNGSVLTFTGVSFTDAYYFTVAQADDAEFPGGISSNLALWLKADAQVYENSGGTDEVEANDNVYVWKDQSGNANDASSAGSSGTRPSWESANMNYNPAIEFDDDGNYHLATSSLPMSDDMTWLVVYHTTQSASSSNFWSNPAIIGGENSSTANDFTLSQQGGKVFFKGTSGDNFGAQSSIANHNGRAQLVSATRVKSSSGTNYLYVNGNQRDSYASDNNSLSDPSTVGIGNHDDPVTGSQFKGRIAEVIGYSDDLTSSDREKVESYLAIKYGMTIQHDYVSSSGTTLWDQSSNSTFHNRVTAIGRDDLSGLDQRQSTSSLGENVVSIGNADIAADNASNSNSFSADESFVIFGDDNDDLFGTHETDYGTTTNAEAIDRRAARTWMLQEYGTVGSVEITFELNYFPGVRANASTYDFTELRLLVDADGTFASGAYSVSPTSYVYNGTDTSVTFHYDFSSGTTYFALATMDEAGSPLPVEFSYFEAEAQDDKVELNWGTATETNNDYFEVQRSQDGLSWESIATVDGGGTKIVASEYLEYDYAPHFGLSYYRIKQVDHDGTTDYSDYREVNFGADGGKTLEIKSIYPNPFNNLVNVEVSTMINGDAQIEVLNSSGAVVYDMTTNLMSGSNSIRVDGLDQLPGGYYVIRVMIGELQASERILKR